MILRAMTKSKITLLIALVFFSVFYYGHVASAVTNDFIVTQTILPTDTTPPNAPTITSATAVSTSQIDLTWSSSTDDVLMGGYQVFRDAVQIATTTLLSYSDTGLTANTSYSYTLRAFDAANNLSSTSAAVSTTTLPAATAVSISPASGGTIDTELSSLSITTDLNTALLKWGTNHYTQYILHWGRTTSYELGYVTTDVAAKDHTTLISDLEPGTIYEYELFAYDDYRGQQLLSRGQFTTLEAPDTLPPNNVSNLQASAENDSVRLNWNNPTDKDFSRVRVVRNNLFYPTDPYDGYIVYDGSREEVSDTDALKVLPGQYYTVFAYDNNGNVSSGAVVYISKSGLPPIVQISTSTETFVLDVSDIYLIQDGGLVSGVDGIVSVDGGKPITIGIPYDALPEHLKTIVVTFTHPSDDSLKFSFLLRVNKDKTAYTANLAPFYEANNFKMEVSVFDYQTKLVKEIEMSVITDYTPPKQNLLAQAFAVFWSIWSLLILIIILVLIYIRKVLLSNS